ncbi:hypothetical protein GCM10009801_42450 [Streptomyces albiaxialis]|uniref:TetR family transcriptional regulator n=1 Tax=Streptomyces albiaxialis TaxID=329523 RepID=A0ABP5HN98_9ACTN
MRTPRDAPAATYPHVVAVSGELVSGADRARLSWGFQALLTGILHTPTPAPESPVSRGELDT